MEKFIFVKPNSTITTKTDAGQNVELRINSFKFEAVISKADDDGYFKAGERVSVVFE